MSETVITYANIGLDKWNEYFYNIDIQSINNVHSIVENSLENKRLNTINLNSAEINSNEYDKLAKESEDYELWQRNLPPSKSRYRKKKKFTGDTVI